MSGIFASAGTATVTNSTIQYNYNGVEETSDGLNSGTLSLGGGGNTVICSSDVEDAIGLTGLAGVSVLNTTSQPLDATNTTWDTAGPDVFLCDPTLTSCTCELTTCTGTAGADGMDAAYESHGAITTTGNAQSSASCAAPQNPNCNPLNNTGCPAGERCCDAIAKGGLPFCDMVDFCPP